MLLAAGVAVAAAHGCTRSVAVLPACDGLLGPPCAMPRCEAKAGEAAALGVGRSGRARTAAPLFGLASNTASEGRIAPGAQARWAARAGAQVVRFAVDWNAVEPRRDQWDEAAWRRYRSTADALAGRGIEPLAVLTNGPRWASEDRLRPAAGHSGYVPIANLDGDRRWRRFVAEAVRRLPSVRDFELWNEPNLPGSWGGRPPDAVHYAHLVREAAPLIHRLRPRARVLAGAVAGVDPAPYVRCLFETGGLTAHDFDAFSLHAYPRTNGGRVEAATNGSALLEQMTAAATTVHEYVPRAPIWITETGVSTTGPDAVAPREQARATCATWRALSRQPGVDAVIFHTLFDAPMFPASSPERGYGWVALDGRDRPRAKPVLETAARARAAGSCA